MTEPTANAPDIRSAASPLTRWRVRVAGMVRQLASALRVLGKGLALISAGAPTAGTVIYCSLVVVLSTLPVAQVWLGKVVVDALAGGGHAISSAPSAALTGVVAPAVLPALLYVAIFVAIAGLEPVRDMLSTWLRDLAVAEIDRRLMAAGAALSDLTRVERPAFQDDLSMVEQVTAHAPTLFRFLQNGLGTALTLGGLLLLLGRLQPLLPVALVLFSVPHVLVAQRMSLLRYRAMLQRSRTAREMDYCTRIVTDPAVAKEIRVFGLGEFFVQRFQERFQSALADVTRLRLGELRTAVAFSGLHALVLAGGFWYVAAQAGAGRLALGEVALYLGAVAQAEGRLLFLSTAFGTLHQVLLQLPALFALLDGARPAIALPRDGRGHATPATLQTGIELARIGFRYPEGTAAVLNSVSAVLLAGKVTALVGANGAGKSTLVKLLTRMYDPTVGEILLDGVPFHAYDLAALRRRIAVVYQDFARFALTLRESIAVGATEAGEVVPIEQAARWAGVDALAAKLPTGYETELTRRFADGVDLSGGEWQKVAIARAAMRDAALVILDEPTAALDAQAEYDLFQRFRELAEGRTVLLISHRFSTVRMADRILVLEDGRISEAGSHAELLTLGGRYATLYELQAGRYR